MTENWDAQLDRCLMNAGILLAESEDPGNHSDRCELVFAWLALADQWANRQTHELEFEKWRAGKDVEEGSLEFELDPEVLL